MIQSLCSNSEIFTWKTNTAAAAVGLIGITLLVVGILVNGMASYLLMGSGSAIILIDIVVLVVLACKNKGAEKKPSRLTSSGLGSTPKKNPGFDQPLPSANGTIAVEVDGITETTKAFYTEDEF